MEIGEKCKINNDSRIYKVTDIWKINKTNYETENSIEYEVEVFVNLEDIDNPKNIKTKVSTINVYPI